MKGKTAKSVFIALLGVLIFSGVLVSSSIAQSESDVWIVHVRHDLGGGVFPSYGKPKSWPHTIITPVGKNMDMLGAFDYEIRNPPKNMEERFLGWRVRFTDTSNGDVIFDSGESIWYLTTPILYRSDRPREMDLLMTAVWDYGVIKQVSNVWKLHASFEFDKATVRGSKFAPFMMTSPIGSPMEMSIYNELMHPILFRPGHKFLGWRIHITSMTDSKIDWGFLGRYLFTGKGTGKGIDKWLSEPEKIWGSGNWDVGVPFPYNPDAPKEMKIRFTPRWAEIPESEMEATAKYWTVYFKYDLRGGEFIPAGPTAPMQITVPAGQDMSLDLLRVVPLNYYGKFEGWSLTLSTYEGAYDGSDDIWDLDEPLKYDPANPSRMYCKAVARWTPDALPETEVWTVHVSHNLEGGYFDSHGFRDSPVYTWPHTIITPVGQSMDMATAFAFELEHPPRWKDKQGPVWYFMGWSVRFMDSSNDRLLFYSGDPTSFDSIWSLSEPFTYDPDNPREMDLLLTAVWSFDPIDRTSRHRDWQVHAKFDIGEGAVWGIPISPFTMSSRIGWPMPQHHFDYLKHAIIFRPGYRFVGWSVRLTDTSGREVYDSGENFWDMDKPFQYNPDYPKEMDCKFTAIWALAWADPAYYWKVGFLYDLDGGEAPLGFSPTEQIVAPKGQSMPLDVLKRFVPVHESKNFEGWNVECKDDKDSRVFYSSYDEDWNLDEPFSYNPNYPSYMTCRLKALWSENTAVMSLPQSEGSIGTAVAEMATAAASPTPTPNEVEPLRATVAACEWQIGRAHV